MTSGRSAVLLSIVAILLPALALVASLPSRPMILAVLNDAAHAPVFAALALVLLRLLGQWTRWPVGARYAAAFVLAVAIGGAVEFIQSLIGRDAQWSDLALDALGAAAAIGLAIALAGRRWLGAAVFVGATAYALWPLGLASLAYLERRQQFPTVLDFDSGLDWYFLESRGVEVAAAARTGCTNFRITGGRWPGLTQAEPEPDWRGHQRLLVDVENTGGKPLTLTLRVHDAAHDNRTTDRFNRSYVLAPATRERIAILTADIAAAPQGRKLDLADVAGLILFAGEADGAAGAGFCLHRVWLE